MDEFVVLLIIALVIIGALVAIGTPLADWASGNFTTGVGPTGNFKLLSSFDLGNVGLTGAQAARSVKFGSFTLGQTQSETLREMASVGVSQGYFGSDPKKFEITVDPGVLGSLRSAKISFDMGETNLYGNLIIKWNDKAVFDRLANLNRFEITIPAEDVKESNVLEMSAAPPGLYFWSATYYGLQNFRVAAEYGPEKIMSFKVYPNELEAWDRGILKFYTTSGQRGDIQVKLNGQGIYSSSNPEHLVTKEFEFSQIGNVIRAGDNIISFRSSSVFELDDVSFDIYLMGGGSVKERYFNLTRADINLLKGSGRGRIEFNVDSVLREGLMVVTVDSHNRNVPAVSGRNVVEFTANDVVEGVNRLAFSGTGSWDVSGVRVGIAY